jgi:hypothetical protein
MGTPRVYFIALKNERVGFLNLAGVLLGVISVLEIVLHIEQ